MQFHDRRWLPLLLLVGLSAGCKPADTFQSTPTPTPAPTATPSWQIVKPEQRALVRIIEQPGMVQAFAETVLYSKLTGYVQSLAVDPSKSDQPAHNVYIDIGSRVQAGQLLAELHLPELEAEYQQAQAKRTQAEAQVVQVQKALLAADAQVVAAAALVDEGRAGLSRAQALFDRWQSESQRVSRLVSGGVIDSQSRDETQNQFKAAVANQAEALAKVTTLEANLAKAAADRERAQAEVTTADAARAVAQAGLDRSAALRSYQQIKAPYAGIVTRRQINVGDLVQANPATGLFAVAQIDPVRIVLQVPEADAAWVQSQQQVQVLVPALATTALVGQVSRTSWSLEPVARTLRVELDMPNPDGKLRPGMYVLGRLTVDLPADWAVPATALTKLNDEPIAYLAEAERAVRIFVDLGYGDGAWTQVRRYRRSKDTPWQAIVGTEGWLTPAATLTDGQTLQPAP